MSAVSGWGTTSRSASLIARQPTTLEPSNPMPSSNVSSVRASAGIEKCCQTPGKSMNRRSTVVTSRCRICAKTSLGVTQPSPLISFDSDGPIPARPVPIIMTRAIVNSRKILRDPSPDHNSDSGRGPATSGTTSASGPMERSARSQSGPAARRCFEQVSGRLRSILHRVTLTDAGRRCRLTRNMPGSSRNRFAFQQSTESSGLRFNCLSDNLPRNCFN